MASLEARLSGWASAESPLHAFSLPSSGADAQAGSARGLGWRQSFGELWSQVALGDLVGRHADPGSVGIRAKRHFEVVQRDLLALWKGSGVSRRSVLRCAAVPLECSARVWQAFGPVAGQRHLHLSRRLEDTLAAAERQIRAAELPLFVNRPAISLAARAARAAIDDLLGASVDPAEALAALEDAAVDLASLAVRIAVNLNEIGSARRAHAKQPAALGRQLEALAGEVSGTAYAQRSLRGKDAEADHLGVWLSATLSVAPPAEAIELASLSSGDPCLRADALFSLRARWLELAVGLWVVLQALDDLLVMGTFGDEGRLKSAVSSRAGIALVACELCQRPGDFDHRQAWDRQREALYELVSDVCLALQTCEPNAVVRSQQLSLRRLARALAAIWTIDERVRSPLAQASRRYPRERHAR
jgi:hypothetical protein